MNIEEKIMTIINYLDFEIEEGNIVHVTLWYKYEKINYIERGYDDYFIIYANGLKSSHQVRNKIESLLSDNSTRITSARYCTRDEFSMTWMDKSLVIYKV